MRKEMYIIISCLMVAVLGLAIGYAALSTTLKTTVSKVTQNPLTWNVGFSGSSATGTAGGTSGTGRSCGNATITAGAVTIADTKLSKPGDSCKWALTIKNSGGINAKITGITPTKPSGITCNTASGGNMVCGNITYKLATTEAGTTVLSTGATVNAGASTTVYLIATYTGTTLNTAAVTQSGAAFAVVYSQA